MQERERANLIIGIVDREGRFERTHEKEFFQITKTSNNLYDVKIVDSDVTQDNHKMYTHHREGLEEFLTALLNNSNSILHRL